MNKSGLYIYNMAKNFIPIGLLLPFCILFCNLAKSQELNLGFPPVTNYNKETYNSGSQNWDVLSHQQYLYFANEGGLLTYNGLNWDVHLTPNNTILRSIAQGTADTVYVGAQGELGYFSPNNSGQLKYTSLLPLLPENIIVDEVWDLIYHNDALFALSNQNQIVKIKDGKAETFVYNNRVYKMSLVGDEIWYHVQGQGIYRIGKNEPELINASPIATDHRISEFLQIGSKTFLFSRNNGIYILEHGQITKWSNNAEEYLKEKKITAAIKYKNDLIVGTRFGGAIRISTTSGKVNLLLDKNHGLQNNYICNLSIDPKGDLWFVSPIGISKIDMDSANEIFYPDGELEGAVYDIEIWNEKIFFCTSNGVYFLPYKTYYNPLKEQDFTLVKGTAGQAWELDIIDDELFCGHHFGAFQIMKDLSVRTLQKDNGAWKFIKLNDTNIAIGTYEGVSIINKKNNTWSKSYTIPGLRESSRILHYDKNKNLWVSHPYKKVYKIQFNEDFTSNMLTEYDKEDGLKTNKRNYVFNVEGECIVTNETGVYKYNPHSNKFGPAEGFLEAYPEGVHLKRIIKRPNKYWAISSIGTDRIDISKSSEGKFSITKHPITTSAGYDNYMGGFEKLYPLSDSVILTCTEKGVNEFSTQMTADDLSAPIISTISLPGQHDSILYAGHGHLNDFHLDTKENSMLFQFVNNGNSQFYTYMLEGLQDEWSDWSSSNTKEYSNLSHGNYKFLVRSVGYNKSDSPITQVKFSIKTPWFKSLLAYLIYGLLFIGGLLSLLLIPRKKYEENTAKLESQKRETEEEMIKVKQETEEEVNKLKREKEMEMQRIKRENEAEMERIQREKLEAEILFKNKELAMSTMNLLQKNETLTAIRSEVEKVIKNIKDPQAKKEAKKIISLLRSDDRLEDDWNNFSIHFDQAHHQFLERLKKKYKNLTPKDQKLCAYLRMNLSTKEIAPLLKISVRGVEISRYRLRKKLAIDKEVNLNSFMMDF